MKAICNAIRLQYNSDQKPEIVLTTTSVPRAELDELRKLAESGKTLEVEIKQFRQKRSLDANSYFWVLLSKMADVLKTTKDELYLQMLDRYGVFTFIVVKPSMVEKVKAQWRTIRELGEIYVNGKSGVQLMCFFGSSTYDTKEMSFLIDGVVQECKELGIETMTKSELELMKSEWARNEDIMNQS